MKRPADELWCRRSLLVIGLVGALAACETAPEKPAVPAPAPVLMAPSVPAPAPPTVPEPEPVPAIVLPAAPATPAAQRQAQQAALAAAEMLETGNEEAAKRELQRALALDAQNALAQNLTRQIGTDPVAVHGRESFAYTVRSGETSRWPRSTRSAKNARTRRRQACELVRNGRLGKLERVMVGLPGSNFNAKPVPDSDPPEELDYDMWLGPAPQRPYNVNRVHYKFRFFWDYSGGQMTNFGAHHIDIAQWGLGMDDSGPVATEGTATFHPEKHYEVTQACRVTHTYANGVILVVGQGEKDCPGGVTFVGSEGTIFVDRGKITSTPEDIVKQPMTDSDERLYVSTNHHQNFMDCLKSRKLPICDVEIGHRAATICHLGNIALRLGRRIQWNPATEQIVGDDDAAKWVSRPYRAPWTLG